MNKIFSTLPSATNKTIQSLTQNPKNGNRNLSAKFENPPYECHMLDSGPPTSTEATKEELFDLYKKMDTIRKMEKEAATLYAKKLIKGFCHLYSGQEAVGVGMRSAMAPQDSSITSYRCHGWMLLMGGTIEEIMGELLGNKLGCARGKGGSMHLYTPLFYGGNGIVGAQAPLGTGVALAHKYREDGGVCITLFGDGASNQGQVYECTNIAKLLNLPVLYVIENNMYGMGTAVHRHASNPHLYTKYCVPGIRVDGMDVLCVRESAKFGLEHCRSGKGPLLLEMMTYRYFGHSMSDPGTSYRSRDEIKQVRETRDPIELLKKKILTSGLGTEEDIKKLSSEAKTIVQEGLDRSMKGKIVDVIELGYDVYSDYKGEIRLPAYQQFIQHKLTNAYEPVNKPTVKPSELSLDKATKV